MKKVIMATLLSSAIVVPAMAASTNKTDFADANYVFNVDNQQVMQLEELSSQEMEETTGEYGPWGFIGGAGFGAWNYLGSSAGCGKFSWSGLAYHVGAGGVAGGIGGPVGLRTYYYGSRFAGVAGFGSGYGSSRGWW